MKTTSAPATERLLSLDALRGLAALAVVAFHWNHLTLLAGGTVIDLSNYQILPFSHVLRPIYEMGYLAVDLFFLLSGFIFFSLYARHIEARSISAPQFAWLRFSRLYPLHLATLIAVVVMQLAYYSARQQYFVYQHNEAWRFVLHLLLASHWVASEPFSFNGPIWSVSIEVLLYVIFFAACRARLTSLLALMCIAATGAALSMRLGYVGSGICSFFAGGICVRIVAFLSADKGYRRRGAQVALITIAGGCVAVMSSGLFGPSPRERFLLTWFVVAVLFPAVVMVLALSEADVKGVSRRLAWLGDISYSSYLLHFPLQLCLALGVTWFGIQVDVGSERLFVGFFAVLIVLALASFHLFERPCQGWLRRMWQGRVHEPGSHQRTAAEDGTVLR